MTDARSRAQGFTLLELLVVLVLVGMLAGLVAPVAQRGLLAARERGVMADLESELEGLPMAALGKGLELDSAGLRKRLPELPDGWQITVQPGLAYGPTGMARAAQVRLQPPSGPAMQWRIVSLTGEARRDDGR